MASLGGKGAFGSERSERGSPASRRGSFGLAAGDRRADRDKRDGYVARAGIGPPTKSKPVDAFESARPGGLGAGALKVSVPELTLPGPVIPDAKTLDANMDPIGRSSISPVGAPSPAIDTSGLFGRTDPYAELRDDAPVDPSAELDRWSGFGDIPISFTQDQIDPAVRFNTPVSATTPVPAATQTIDLDPFRTREGLETEISNFPRPPGTYKKAPSMPGATTKRETSSSTLERALEGITGFIKDPGESISNIDPFDLWMTGMGLSLPVPPKGLQIMNEGIASFFDAIGLGMSDEHAFDKAAQFTDKGQFTVGGWPGLREPDMYDSPRPDGPRLPKAPLGADIGLAPTVAPQGPSDAQLTDFLQQGFRSQLVGPEGTFPGDAFELDQFLIDEIVNERLGSAQEQVALAGGSGILNEAGSGIANEFFQQQLEAAGQSVRDIGGGVISGFQSDVDAIRDRGLADIGNFQFGDPFFDPSTFAAERAALIGERTPILGTDIRTALGSDPLFDVSEALRLGGGGQGLVSGIPSQSSQALLDVLAANTSGATPITRTISSSGSGIF